jgi:peptide deformylase
MLDKKQEQEAVTSTSTTQEEEKKKKIIDEYARLLGRYVEPHNKKSKWVTKKDLKRVISDGHDLAALCNIPRGELGGIAALAHMQIDAKNPLRFFMILNGMVIINPVIINHTKTTIIKNEGCMSYPYRPVKMDVERYHKITVLYQTLEKTDGNDSVLSKPILEGFSGNVSHVFQHEISHCNGVNIYDKDYKPESCEGLGEGLLSKEEAEKLFIN